LNAAVNEEGKTCAITSEKTFQNKAYLGQIGQSVLYNHLKKCGHNIELVEELAEGTNTKFKVARFNGIDATARERFSKRTTQIEGKVKEYADKDGASYEDTYNAKTKKKASLATRKEKKEPPLEELEAGWKKDVAECGITLETIQNHKALEPEKTPDTISLTEQFLNEVNENKGILTDTDLRAFICRELAHKSLDEIKKGVDEALSHPELVNMGIMNDNNRNTVYTTQTMLRIEREAIRALDTLHKDTQHRLSDEAVEKAADTFAKSKGGYTLTEDQMRALKHITRGTATANLEGIAGAGKSVSMRVANNAWTSAGFKVFGLAMAGKAADVLQESSGINSQTVKRFLIEVENGKIKLDNKSIICVDEAAMLATPDYAKIIGYAEKNGCKLVNIGDLKQSRAIGAGGIFKHSIDTYGREFLSENWRQKNAKTGTVEDLKHLRDGKVKDYLDGLRATNSLVVDDDVPKLIDKLVKEWSDDKRETSEKLVMSEMNKYTQILNERLRNELVKSGQVEEGKLFEMQNKDDQIVEKRLALNDRIMFLENTTRKHCVRDEDDKIVSVKNGNSGKVIAIEKEKLTVKMDNGKTVSFDTKTYNRFDYAYARTVSKSQGDGENAAYKLELNSDRNSSYVGSTRHKQKLTVFTTNENIERLERSQFRYDELISKTVDRQNVEKLNVKNAVEVKAVEPVKAVEVVDSEKSKPQMRKEPVENQIQKPIEPEALSSLSRLAAIARSPVEAAKPLQQPMMRPKIVEEVKPTQKPKIELDIRELIKIGANDDIRKMLEAGYNPNDADENGNTALHHAAAAGQVGTYKLLIEQGADKDLLNHKSEWARELLPPGIKIDGGMAGRAPSAPALRPPGMSRGR